MSFIKKKLKLAYAQFRRAGARYDEATLLLAGKQMSWRVAASPPNVDLRTVGFKVFSQWDEDGIIQYLIHNLEIRNRTFVEFGIENYEESNTRFLLLNDDWQGLVLDGCGADIDYVQKDPIYWQHDLQAKCSWITRENVNPCLLQAGFGEDLGLLSIDIDGNDYWVWEAIDCVKPRIVVVEYNSVFGLAPISVPYKADFNRTAAHYSNLYFGCSIGALSHLAMTKGYQLLGSNSCGSNAFFVRSDIAGPFKDVDVQEAYLVSRFRESRSENGRLSYARGADRASLIAHLPVVNVVSGETGPLGRLSGCEIGAST